MVKLGKKERFSLTLSMLLLFTGVFVMILCFISMSENLLPMIGVILTLAMAIVAAHNIWDIWHGIPPYDN